MKRTVPIDGAGRIVLPKEIRENLAIQPGDNLNLLVEGNSITLTPNKKTGGLVRKGKALVFSTQSDETFTHETINQLIQEARNERDEPALAFLPAKSKA